VHIRFSSILILLFVSQIVYAKSLGVYGPVYEIQEESILVTIENKLKDMEATGELAIRMEEAKTRSIKSVEEPPTLGIQTSDKSLTSYYDPSIKVTQDIGGVDGAVILRKGTVINPLDQFSMNSELLFFDGDSESQRQYALALIKKNYKIKPILTGGKPLALMRQWKKRLYYDQGGKLVEKLGIKYVPSIVKQEGKKLRVDVIPTSMYEEDASQ